MAGRPARALTSAALALLVGCTGVEAPAGGPRTAGPSPGPTPTQTVPEEDAHVLGVIASLSGPEALAHRPFLDGMALAEAEINRGGGVAGKPLRLQVVEAGDAAAPALAEMLVPDGPAAVLLVGDGEPVRRLRPGIEARGAPVIVLGADLYSDRGLYRQVFQTSPPLRWQARVVARYLLRDRGHRRVVVVRQPGDPARAAFLEELRSEGVGAAATLTPRDDLGRADGADALLALVDLRRLPPLLDALKRLGDPPQLVLPADLLRTDLEGLPPGTVAPGPYTWAPWARPIARVRAFRSSFRRSLGRPAVGAEQEGYDAVRILARGLETTGGGGGERLVRALERSYPTGPVFSSTSVTLSPDDHLFPGELWLGLYAVPGRGERPEPWLTGPRWRPIVRTFTYDGRRTLFPERDRRVFFPFWRPGRPSPRYARSRWGIVTGPEDPLH